MSRSKRRPKPADPASHVVLHQSLPRAVAISFRTKRVGWDVALETTGLSKAELAKLLDPATLTKGGIHGGGGGGGG